MSKEFVQHPFEDLFDIDSGTTLVNRPEFNDNGMVVYEQYDEKEKEIEEQYQTVYNAAFAAFTNQVMSAQMGDNPAYHGKNLEAAAKFLATALDAVKEKAELKHKKDKSTAKPSATNVTNNNLIMDREDLINMLQGKVIDG